MRHHNNVKTNKNISKKRMLIFQLNAKLKASAKNINKRMTGLKITKISLKTKC